MRRIRIALAPARLAAAGLAALLPALMAEADEPVGILPPWAFPNARNAPTCALATMNDSNGLGVGASDWDDYRSFGFRASAGLGDVALGASLDSITFRGANAEQARRIDELGLSAGWAAPRREAGGFALAPWLGAGARVWGDFGQAAIQESWHGLLGTARDFPLVYLDPPPPEAFAWAALGLSRDGPLTAEARAAALFTSSGALESSLSLRLTRSSSLSSLFAFFRREDRLGSLSEPQALLAGVEAGNWLGWGAGSGFVLVENAMNLSEPFATCTVALRSPPPKAPRRGPPGELVIGTSLVRPEFDVARLVVLPRPPGSWLELHAGIAQRVGSIQESPAYGACSRFQAGGLILEAFARRRGADPVAAPFVGLAAGARSDSWFVPRLERAVVLGSSWSAEAGVWVGLRLDPARLRPPPGFRLALDLAAGWSLASKDFPGDSPELSLRAAVLDY